LLTDVTNNIDITNDSYLDQEITTLFFKLQPNLYTFQVASCHLENLNTNTIYRPGIEPYFYSGISYFNFHNLNIPIAALDKITI